MHHRLEPKKNRFVYNIFMFYLDLDEIDLVTEKLFFFSRNKFNWFNFRDKDHIQFPREEGPNKKNVKQNILEFLKANNVNLEGGKIMLLTHVCTWGYIFNPVSFYYCFDKNGKAISVIVEVCNTFGEMKMYILGKETLNENEFNHHTTKYFYVSPFVEADTEFDFRLRVPEEKLKINIDDYKNGKKFLLSALTGQRRELNNFNLLVYGLRFPFITLKVIFLIHWQALILYFKKIPYYKKLHNIHLQKEVYNSRN
ncbi:MAG: DUF1365 domain-containing protein [Cytophagaceae bacterium]|nr:DUF1365 domain-containing protein [Cytophagaceae bacterium]